MSTEALRRIEEIGREPNEDGTCIHCGAMFTIDDGCVPTALCHHCAQILLPKFCRALRIAIKALDEISWSKISRAPLTQSQDRRVAESALYEINEMLK